MGNKSRNFPQTKSGSLCYDKNMDILIFSLGVTAGALTTISFLPQVIKAHQSRHTKDLSLAMLLLFSLGLIIWTTYGFLIGELPIILANGTTLLLLSYLLYLKAKYG